MMDVDTPSSTHPQASVYASSLAADPLSSPLASVPASSPPSVAVPAASPALGAPPAASNFSKSLADSAPSSSGNSLSPQQNQRSASNGRDNRFKHPHSMVSPRWAKLKGAMLCFFLRSMAAAKLQLHPIIPSLPKIDPPPPASAPPSSASSAAAVAPAPNPSPPPFSSSFQPIPAKLSQQTQSMEARQSNAEAAAAAQSSSSHAGPRTENQKKSSKKTSDLNFLSSLLNKALSVATSHPASSAASSSSSSSASAASSAAASSSLSLADAATCHCLVVDDSVAAGRLPEGSDNWKQYREALALEGNHDALLKHLAKWLQLPLTDLTIAYVPKQNPPRLHINFQSLPVLGQALLAHPFLVRCGSIGAWSKPCGVLKRDQPELLHLSCVPSHPCEMATLTADVTQLLTDMGLLYTSFWFPNKMTENRVTIFVLPRNLVALEAEIHRLHLKHEFRGSKVRVQGVNTLALRRCHQCERLGHNPDACSKYSGMALRLIGKKPLSYLLLQELQKRTGARTAFLGSSFDEMQPSRRLTLLFDMPAGHEEERMAELAPRLAPIFAELHSLLHGSPQCVDISDRHRECRECGSMERPHECPFMDPTRVPRQQAPTGAPRPQALAGAAASASSSASSAADKMCGSWSRTRTCAKKGLGCGFSHPEGHIVAQKSKECFAFQRNGLCHVGSTCPYKHTEGLARRPAGASAASDAAARPATSKPSDKPSGQVSLAHAPPAAATSTSTPASSPVAPTPTASPSKKKRQRTPVAADESQPEEEEEEVKQQASAAKKQKPVQGIPAHSTQWSTMVDEAEEEDEGERTRTPPPRSSSLASISSPSSSVGSGWVGGSAAASARGRGRPSKPVQPAAASASAKAPSRSSSSSRKLQQ